MKNCCITIFIFLLSLSLQAQAHKTVSGEIEFFSSAPVEDIQAVNNAPTGLFNEQTGSLAFLVPIKAFQFPKSLMQEHFNDKFMESHTYPEATFEGKLSGYDRERSGSQGAFAEGNLTIHGQTNKVRIPGNIIFKSDQIIMDAVFPVKLEDYDIQIPKVLFYNIAEEVEVTVRFVFEKTDR
ncbi:YceI family protein [Cyclobacterium plantarum]|uniref:YceI family protein n=1 Tax=Cyclobacterium plantarum TaxID=2716263 RepID=UPI003F6E8DCF